MNYSLQREISGGFCYIHFFEVNGRNEKMR